MKGSPAELLCTRRISQWHELMLCYKMHSLSNKESRGVDIGLIGETSAKHVGESLEHLFILVKIYLKTGPAAEA